MCKFSLVSVHLIKCIKWSIARVWQTAGREMTVLYHLLRLFTYNEEEIDHRGRKEKESHFPISSLFVLFWLLLWWEANPPPPLGRRRYWSSKLSSFPSPLLRFSHFSFIPFASHSVLSSLSRPTSIYHFQRWDTMTDRNKVGNQNSGSVLEISRSALRITNF